jgi:DNA primase
LRWRSEGNVSVFESLREHVDLAELAGQFTELRCSGNSSKGRCPFPDHEDLEPSFHVWPDDRFTCFGCGRHGDATDLWAGVRGIEPGIETALELAQEHGVELPERDPEAQKKAEALRKRETEYLRQTEGCHEALVSHENVTEWWEERGFDQGLRERFLLGANQDGTAATIPFWNRGRVQGLIRRKLEGEPKYLYPKAEDFPTGHRPLFVPGPVRDGAYLVEGVVDALAVAALGESAFAVGGTNISEKQVWEITRLPGYLYILPDADEEGGKAAHRWARQLYPRVLLCPAEYGGEKGHASKDFADSFAAEGKTAKEHLERAKARAVDALDLALKAAPVDSTRERYRYARENVLPLLLCFEDPIERAAALADVAKGLKLGLRDMRKALAALEEEEPRWEDEAQGEVKEPHIGPEALPKEAERLISCPGVLRRYVEDVAHIHGVVRDREVLGLQVLVAVGAQLEPFRNGRPAGPNLILTAEAGRGKNFVCDAAAAALPEEFYLAFESASAKSLYYLAENDPAILKHRWLYPNEAEAADELVELFRPLLSGGKASHLTVNKNGEGRNTAQELNIEGPASVTIPTVRNKLDAQLQTRMLVAELEDYEGRVAEHSRALSRQLLPHHAGEDHTPKIRDWQAALRSLTGGRRVVFPLDREEFCFDSDQVGHGARLWGSLLGLMLAHAWLEQRNRNIVEFSDEDKAIVATPDDYETAYKVFEATCERSVANLSDTHRKILDAVHAMKRESDKREGFSLRKIGDKAGVHHSTVAEQKTYLTKSAKLLREAEGGLDLVVDAEPSWWHKGDLLVGFPRPEQVRRWWEETTLGPDSPRHARHPEGKAPTSDTSAEKPVGPPARQHSPSTRQSTTEEVSGDKISVSDGEPDNKIGLDKRRNGDRGLLSGVSGTSGEDPEESFSERVRFTI